MDSALIRPVKRKCLPAEDKLRARRAGRAFTDICHVSSDMMVKRYMDIERTIRKSETLHDRQLRTHAEEFGAFFHLFGDNLAAPPCNDAVHLAQHVRYTGERSTRDLQEGTGRGIRLTGRLDVTGVHSEHEPWRPVEKAVPAGVSHGGNE